MSEFKKPAMCAGCPLEKAPGPVFGEGDPTNARLIYIAQNPGQQEVAGRRPLIGPSGQVFNRQCTEAGLSREEFYLTNQVKCLTPNNREPTDAEVAHCKPILEAELARCKSDTVILSGGVAFKANIGHYSSLSPSYRATSSIFERMGCVEQRNGRKWIGTLHPAFIMRMPDFREVGPMHLRKASALAGFKLKSPTIRERVDDREVLEFVDQTILGSREFADDVETVGLEDVDEDDYVGGDWIVTMLGVANQPWEALVLGVDQIKLLAPIFADPEIWRYEQNGEYDNYFLERFIDPASMVNRRFDTMQGTHWLRSHMPKKLKPFILSVYTWLPYYNRDLDKVSSRLYNGMDLVTTFQAAKEMRRQFDNDPALREVFFSLGQPIPPILEEWRRIGLNVDVRRAFLFKKIIEGKMLKAQDLIGKICGNFFNPNSPQQVKALLYESWKLPIQYKADRGAPGGKRVTTDYEARKVLRKWLESRNAEGELRKDTPQYRPAYLYVNLQDFLSGEKKKLEYLNRISPDCRIHPFYKAHGQKVFRLGSTPSVVNIPVYDISAWGGARRDDNDTADNPIDDIDVDKDEERAKSAADNKPKLGSLRSLIIPDREGDLLLTCDFEQMQLWILAAQFKVKWLLDIFESRDYFYGIVYEKLYNEPFFQPGKPRTKKFKLPISEQRIRRAKAVPLGFVFNRTGEAVAAEYGWTPEEGRAYRRWFMDLCKELGPAYADVEYKVRQKGKLRHIFGQVMHFPDAKIPAAINSLAQSNEAMIVRESIILINREFIRRGWKPAVLPPPPYPAMTRQILSVHDSLTFNINTSERGPNHLMEVYEEVVKPVIERPIPQLGGFRFRHSAEVSTQWDWNVTDYAKWKETIIGARS